jgi:hypothetical protein
MLVTKTKNKTKIKSNALFSFHFKTGKMVTIDIFINRLLGFTSRLGSYVMFMPVQPLFC